MVSGPTPAYIMEMLNLRKPVSLAICALDMKPAQPTVVIPIKYVGFELGSETAVEYGVGSGVDRVLTCLLEL